MELVEGRGIKSEFLLAGRVNYSGEGVYILGKIAAVVREGCVTVSPVITTRLVA